MTPEQLAERVEALAGPDREVDAEIAVRKRFPDYRFPHRVLNRRPRDYREAWERSTHDGMGGSAQLPAYTASLDAAMTLVPDCHRAGVLHRALQNIQRTGFPNSTFLQRLILNVVAQALRALASQQEERT